jgi:class 3 adenylate cyclase
VHQPTLVMHRERSRAVPVRAAQRLAARLPNASLCVLDGDAHNLHEGDWRSPLRAVGEFLGIDVDLGSSVTAPSSQTSLSVVMFTDMVGSTAMTTRFGDQVSQLARRRHDVAVREALHRCGGTEIKHTGDGIMASFHSVVEAARAAMTISGRLDAPSPAHEPELAVKSSERASRARCTRR